MSGMRASRVAFGERDPRTDQPETAVAWNNLALLYRLQGRFSEAEPLYERALVESTAASEDAVKAAAPGHAVLHFATHGFFEREGLVSRWQKALQRAHSTREARGFGALAAPSDRWGSWLHCHGLNEEASIR